MIESIIFLLIIALREYSILLERREWASERSELLNRIQAPDRLPAAQIVDFEFPEPEPDEFNLVGTIADMKND
jgi:hypothetical protein